LFTLVINRFRDGIAKVIGGHFNVLATTSTISCRQQFLRWRRVGRMLLAPAALAFAIDRVVPLTQWRCSRARRAAQPQPKLGRGSFSTPPSAL